MIDRQAGVPLAAEQMAMHPDMRGDTAVIYVESWAAVLPDGKGGAPLRLGACVDDTVIPAGHRRRLNAYGRMAVSCGLSVADADSSDVVFCSRYGDIDLAYRLLQALGNAELMSPAAFSLSVHNAVPGVMDLVRKSRVGHTAIAAGLQSLSAGLAEVWAKILANAERKVTLVFAEGELPTEFKPFSDAEMPGSALAMTLSARQSGLAAGRIMLMEVGNAADMLDEPSSERLVRGIVAALSGGKPEALRWRSRGLCWCFEAASDAMV